MQLKQRIGADPGATTEVPETAALIGKMIRADPWNCDLIVTGDPRKITCELKTGEGALDPHNDKCSFSPGGCNIEHANAFRTLQKVGSLPCCPTPPFCAAPTCAEQLAPAPTTCTKRSAAENLAYLKDPDVWPAYHGWGGANEVDTLKLIDMLGCKGKGCKEPPFDLMLDLGANTGYYTEKLTVRKFAKHYVMVEANPVTSETLYQRWGNESWKKDWFTKQVPHDPAPSFQVINQALSNHSQGEVDMCQTEESFKPTGSCKVPIASVDSLVPEKLTPELKEHFTNAQSAFIKVDTEGMDELVLRGMTQLLNAQRGVNEDGSPRFLVNFLQFEWSPWLMSKAKKREGFQEYDVKSVTQFLESLGFETFLIGPRYLPLSHGSYADEFKTFSDDPNNNAGVRVNYPNFDDRLCKGCNTKDHESFTGDILAIRASHPRLTELKVALGACEESKDFDIKDPQYTFSDAWRPSVQFVEEYEKNYKQH